MMLAVLPTTELDAGTTEAALLEKEDGEWSPVVAAMPAEVVAAGAIEDAATLEGAAIDELASLEEAAIDALDSAV